MSEKNHRTTAQPAEILVLEMDFVNRLASGESILAGSSEVKAYDYDNNNDTIGTEDGFIIVGACTVSGTKLQQRTIWHSGEKEQYKLISFRAKVGSGEFDSRYEDDIVVLIDD